jgi:protein ImuB
MSRIVSVWLPRWPILRYLATQTKKAKQANPSDKQVDPDRPFVLAVTASGGPRVAALNEAAEVFGLAIGDAVADARAKARFLQVRPIDAAADAAALRRLALWATRYTPTASPWGDDNGADGCFLDIEGAAHLFGGEERLLAELYSRLENLALPARLAVADTAGAAWALSHFAAARFLVLPSGAEAEALAPLPIEALRLAPETRAALRRLGFKTVGALLDKPRAPFAARFPTELLRRIDQALGRLDEPLVPVVAPPVYHSLHYLIEPIITQQAVVARANRLMQTLAQVLARDDVGARALRLCLYRVDGAVETIDIALTLPTRDVCHVARLIDLKLEALAATEDAGFGFEAIGLAVTRAEPMPARQMTLNVDRHPEVRAKRASKDDGTQIGYSRSGHENIFEIGKEPISIGASATSFEGHLRWPPQDEDERCAALIDKLCQRLGPQSVRRFEAVESYIPERAEALALVDGEARAWPALEEKSRPLLLLPRAEPTEVTALVPDGPPRRFSWRGVTHDVIGAQGPERIAGEWWLHRMPGPTRDYYVVEDADGHRFWLYREGLYGRETTNARWFVHGLFG